MSVQVGADVPLTLKQQHALNLLPKPTRSPTDNAAQARRGPPRLHLKAFLAVDPVENGPNAMLCLLFVGQPRNNPQVRQRVQWLLSCGFDHLGTELGSTEFTRGFGLSAWL